MLMFNHRRHINQYVYSLYFVKGVNNILIYFTLTILSICIQMSCFTSML